MNRKRLILFVLVILFGIAAFWSYSAIPRPKKVSTLTFKPGQQAKVVAAAATNKPASTSDDGSRLKISLLDTEPAAFKGYRHNIFKPIYADPMKVLKQRAVVIKQPPRALPLPVMPVIAQPVVAPLARFTFLGFLKKGSVRTIFLAKDNAILLVKKGDIVAGRYAATDISDRALTLKTTDTGAEIVIPLIENMPLATAR